MILWTRRIEKRKTRDLVYNMGFIMDFVQFLDHRYGLLYFPKSKGGSLLAFGSFPSPYRISSSHSVRIFAFMVNYSSPREYLFINSSSAFCD